MLSFAVRKPACAANYRMDPRRLRSPDAAEAGAPQKFEELLGRLEQIVSDMETADLPLDKLLSSYEEGMRLVKACGDKLADAEQKVVVLSKSVQAAESKVPPTPAETALPEKKPDEDIRLF